MNSSDPTSSDLPTESAAPGAPSSGMVALPASGVTEVKLRASDQRYA